jgi:glycosyltransferase involved in cell wall biosynthesis
MSTIKAFPNIMKILIGHNAYRQYGGEDGVVTQEEAMLQQAGHQVVKYYRSNHEIDGFGIFRTLGLPKRMIWAGDTVRDLRVVIDKEKPDVAHFHNTFALISPAAYYVCNERGVPVVQTLHNYRLLCLRADFFGPNKILCEDCLGKVVPWPGIVRGCYHGVRSHSAAVATMLMVHRWLKTWQKKVDVYVALTEFARQKFIQGKLPADRIVVKPNFVFPDPGIEEDRDDYAIFVGRLAPEKKIVTLLNAVGRSIPTIPLKIAGTGPQIGRIRQNIKDREMNNVDVLGHLPHEKVIALMKKARFLIFPSEWYEGFPLTIAEAFACGTPVIASKLGSMAEIVEHEYSGLLYESGNSDELGSAIMWAWTHIKEMEAMGRNARKVYEEKYSVKQNYPMLMDIYQLAINKKK